MHGAMAPVCSVIGGLAAQEVIKALTQHTTPLQQTFLFDCSNLLPDLGTGRDEFEPQNSRYDAQAALWGWTLQEKLQRQRWFVVGAGAIGCEHLKNLALLGVGTKEDGEVILTDMDSIELSNLSRQFLFRRSDIGVRRDEVQTKEVQKNKAKVAALAAQQFNSALNIEVYDKMVADETRRIFDDPFWLSLNGILPALDNIKARRFVDSQTVYYGKPMIDSGTQGLIGNTQVVYPHLTKSYGETYDGFGAFNPFVKPQPRVDSSNSYVHIEIFSIPN